MKHDYPIGQTLAEGARRSCDTAILEALAAAEAEAARFEAMDLLPGRQDTHRGMLKSAAYFEAEYQRCQLLDDLRRRLQRGDLVATARERPTGPRIEVAAESWQYLCPHFAADTARDGLGAVVLFQVRIAEAAPAQVSLAQDAVPPAVTAHADPKPVYSLSTLRAWYMLRRSSWPATEQPPSEADDLAAASQHFGVNRAGDIIAALDAPMDALRDALARKPGRPMREPGSPLRPREGTKLMAVLAMLRRPEGATVAQVGEATGWGKDTVRGFFAGLKKKGITVEVAERIRQVGPNRAGSRGSYTVCRNGSATGMGRVFEVLVDMAERPTACPDKPVVPDRSPTVGDRSAMVDAAAEPLGAGFCCQPFPNQGRQIFEDMDGGYRNPFRYLCVKITLRGIPGPVASLCLGRQSVVHQCKRVVL